jgi:hypothetical protein
MFEAEVRVDRPRLAVCEGGGKNRRGGAAAFSGMILEIVARGRSYLLGQSDPRQITGLSVSCVLLIAAANVAR